MISQDSTVRRQQAAMELVQSEKMYYTVLDTFSKAFFPPIKEHPQLYSMTPTQAAILSDTFEQIVMFSSLMEQDPNLGLNPSLVFNANLKRCTDLYSLYITQSIHHIFGLLNELTGNKPFRNHLRHVQMDLRLNIIDSFLTPTTRLSVYELMLRKYAQTGDPNSSILLQCADILKDCTSGYTQLLEDIERSGKVLGIQLELSMVGNSVVYLWNPERHLVQEAVALKSKISLSSGQQLDTNRAHGENKRRMLLFNDQLMWTTLLPNSRYKGHVSLVDIELELGQPEVPSLLVKPSDNSLSQGHNRGESNKSNKNNDTDGNKNNNEAWMILFDDVIQRDIWHREIKSLQSQLQNLTTDSTLTIPIEVKEHKQAGCCVIM